MRRVLALVLFGYQSRSLLVSVLLYSGELVLFIEEYLNNNYVSLVGKAEQTADCVVSPCPHFTGNDVLAVAKDDSDV